MIILLKYMVWNGNPEIIDLGFIALRWYSLCFVAAFVASYQILKGRFKRDDVRVHVLDTLTIYIVVGTIIGARLGHCLFYDFAYYKNHVVEIFLPVTFEPNFKFTGYQGLASHGGAIGILIAVSLFSARKHVPLYWILDKIALVIPLAGCLIRLGNFMNSEMIGTPTTVPWAVIFRRVDNVPRHPGQLYEAVLYFLVFACLRWLDRMQNRRQNGFLFGIFLVMLFSARFITEFWKQNQVSFEDSLSLNMGQLLSIPFILLGFILAFAKRHIIEETHPIVRMT